MTPSLCPGHDDAVQAAPGSAACPWHLEHCGTVLESLAAVWEALGEPRWPSMVPRQGSGGSEAAQPISDARREARTAIKAVLVSWVLVLVEAGRVTVPDTLPNPIRDRSRHLEERAMGERCNLSDLPTDQCACRIHAKPEPVHPLIAAGYAFEARFPGQCPACDERIDVGADICRTTEGDYVHAECVEGDR